MNFNNQNYEVLVKDLIHDISYANTSNRGKISTIRQYAEVCIRKILDIPQEEEITLGKKTIQDKIKGLNLQTNLLANSIKEIQKFGNNCTHTQFIEEVSKKDVENISKVLLNLYAVIFILYFQKYKFGSNLTVISMFSILPPMLRFIVLDYLYKEDKNNITVIDKLGLILCKNFNKEIALEWLEEQRDHLEKCPCYTQEGINQLKEKCGNAIVEEHISNAPKNMYVSCLEKIEKISGVIEKEGQRYTNFEDAKQLYLKESNKLDTTLEKKDFKNIMDFVYLGRIIEENEKLNEQYDKKYFIQN